MAGILVLLTGVLAILILPGIIFYLLFAFGLYTLARNNGYEDKAILAFIPFANAYLFGLMSGDARILNTFDLEKEMVGLALAVGLPLSAIPVVGIFIFIAYVIVSIYAYYNLFMQIDEDNAKLMTILCILLPFVKPIYIFIKRNSIFTPPTTIIY